MKTGTLLAWQRQYQWLEPLASVSQLLQQPDAASWKIWKCYYLSYCYHQLKVFGLVRWALVLVFELASMTLSLTMNRGGLASQQLRHSWLVSQTLS